MKNIKSSVLNVILSTLTASALLGCGAEKTINVKELPPSPLTGRFVDSPVQGLTYNTATVTEGVTNENGEFSYFRGEIITFSIGELVFPSVPVSSIMSPLNLHTADTVFSQPVVNTLRLLQSLDADGDTSNGITISADAAAAAQMQLAEGQTVEEYFNRPADEFAADVEAWLPSATGVTQLVSFDEAVAHFVNFLETDLGTLFGNAFKVDEFTGVIFNPAIVNQTAGISEYDFTPSDDTGLSGVYTFTGTDQAQVSGTYQFEFGRRVLTLTSSEQVTHLISRSFNTVDDVYSLCIEPSSDKGLATLVADCSLEDDEKINLFTFSQQQADAELVGLAEREDQVGVELIEEFSTTTEQFFNSSYQSLSKELNDRPLYVKTGGSPALNADTGTLTLAGSRFSIGNAADDTARETTSGDTYSTGIYNISEGFTISFDVIAHNGAGSLSLYVDNNTTGQDNSVHGKASKFYGKDINEENTPAGQTFVYTYIPGQDVVTGEDLTSPSAQGVLNTEITNSFFQFRTDSAGSITIDNLMIDVVAEAVDPNDIFIPPEPIEFTDVVDFTSATDDSLFSPAFLSMSGEAGTAEDIPLFTKTGGTVSVTASGIQLDSGRFTMGDYKPSEETTATDTSATGVLDLSKPYQVVMDIISVSDSEGDNTFEVYVDNNTSSSANSMHGEDSRIFKSNVLDLAVGELVIPGNNIGTDKSFLQFRTSSNGVVEFNNVRIEYIVQAPPIKVSLPYQVDFLSTTTDSLFTPEFQSIDGKTGVSGDIVAMYERTGGNVDITAQGLLLDAGRFTLGNTTPETDTADSDTSTSGVFDLSRPYQIKLNVLQASNSVEGKTFQVYVDNNTSSSSKSIHGGSSKFYQIAPSELTTGELVIDGFLATGQSFIQFRTETGALIEFNDLRIEYLSENLLLEETFTDSSAENFFTAEYKALPSDSSAPMYNITGGGSAMVFADNQLTLSGSRFTLGETNPGTDTADGVAPQGSFDLSKPYKVYVDIVAIDPDSNMTKDFLIYVDNNTSSSAKSHLGGDSKFFAVDLADLTVGQTIEAEGLLASANSFLQFRTEGSATVTIDNIRIEYIDTNMLVDEVFDGATAEDFFTADYKALPNDTAAPLYNITGGGSAMVFADDQLTLSGSRFTLGETNPGTDTADGIAPEGALDLSIPYKVLVDIVAIDPDSNMTKDFLIYVDNNTSSSAKSHLGGDSKFFASDLADLVVGQTLEVEGLLATKNSFLQIRTEGSATVTIDNLRIEYLEQDNSVCGQATDLYFCDDFTDGNLDNWQILASSSGSTAEGEFDVLTLEDGNNVMRYTAGGAGGELIVATDVAMANVPDSGNFYVEADIRPRQNSTTANKQLYLMARYLSEGNWLAGGLNMQNSSSSTQVEIAVTTDGAISRPVQSKTPMLLGEKGGTEDGVWYTVRFELIDDALTVYLNGENMGTVNDSTYTAKGLVGIFTNNRSFELDNLKVGDPSIKPIQLTLDYKEPNWDVTTTTDPLVINIAAFQDDGITADNFTVNSSNNTIVSADVDGTIVTLTPVSEGAATITFVSGSDANIVRSIEVTIESGFIQPSMDYGSIAGLVTPDVNSTGGYTDTNLRITFDEAITLDNGGEVHIYKASDDSLVDLLRVGYNVDVLSALDKTRELKYTPLSIAQDGKTLVIDPRNDVLEYGETYYVVIGDKVVSGAKLNGIDFIGLGKVSDWSFTTKFVGPATNHILVDDDGEADFRTVQGALTHIMQNVGKEAEATVSIKDGVYNELLFLRNQNNITLQGESRDNTIVQYENYESLNGGSSGRPLFLVESADMLVLNNFTIKNTHVRNNTDSNQAETIYFNSSHRLIANNMNFISEQDTLLIKGYAWFYNTLVAGNVDFIWGYPVAALFEESEIRTIGDSKNGPTDVPVDGGYVLQSRTPVLTDPGFVFLNSEFTHGAGPLGNTVAENSTYIARGAGKTDSFDNVTLINNKFDTHIITSGWYPTPTPNPAVSDALSGFREYGSMDMAGNPLDVSNREGGVQLVDSEVTELTSRTGIFASFNNGAGWSPEPLAIPTLPEAPAEAEEVLVETGFAGYNFDITGGAGGITVTVNNGVDLINALDEAKDANSPITIYVNGTITDANSGNTGNSIDIKDMNDVSIIGVGSKGELDGIGIQIRRASNIIIQNLTIHEVLTGGKDGISIEGDDDGSTTSNIWIDHNELYSSLEVDKDYYDGLLDSKSGAENITISYNYLHDSWKTSLHGHSDDDSNDNKNRHITFHHNRFENLESRVPLFRFGFGHLYNNYFNNIRSTAINSRMGAELQIENNYFENTQNPIVSFYSDNIGYWNQAGNFFGTGVTWTTPSSEDATGQDGSSTSTYQVPYDYTLDPADEVKDKVIANAGAGKLDQSDLDIPEVEENEPLDPPIQSDVSLPYSENFSASNSDEFFSNTYRDLSGSAGDGTPMYHRVTGTVSIENGELTITGARVSIGNTTGAVSTTDADTSTTGVFDLSNAYQVSFKVVSVSGNTDKNFQIYVDNNTSGSSNSIHGGSSKFYSIALSELVPGQTYVVDGLAASATSFITLRSESDATITLDDLTIQ